MMSPLIKPSLVSSYSSISRQSEFYFHQKDAFNARLLKRLKQANSTDVILVSKDGKEFASHKVILGSLSSYFSCLFGDSFIEGSSDRIVLHSIHSRIMRFILEYMEVELEGLQAFKESVKPVATEVFLAAHMLDIPGLIQLSCTILGENLTHENYKEVWTLYSSCNTEMLKDYLITIFRENYRQLLVESIFLDFDLPLVKFVLEQSMPFVNQKWLVKMMLHWIKHDLKHRECFLGELMTMVNKERLPCDYIQHLAQQEELLQKHPELLEQFPTVKRMVVGSVGADDGGKFIADSVAMFAVRQPLKIMQSLYFSGRTEERRLPWRMPMLSRNTRICVQYKRNVFFVGRLLEHAYSVFCAYRFNDNRLQIFTTAIMVGTVLAVRPIPIQALKYRDAFVVEDKMYLHCSDSNGWFVKCYDFYTYEWARLLNLPQKASLCPYQNSFLILQPDPNDAGAIMATKFNEAQSFTIPTDYDNGIFFHCNGRLWGFLDHSNKQFVFEMDTKCLKVTETSSLSFKSTATFERIPSQRHPLIAKYEEGIVTLIDLEYGVEVGRLRYNTDWSIWAAYCDDPTL